MRGKRRKKLPVWLTASERERVLSLELSVRDRAIVTTLLYTGLRASELVSLDIEDLDFDEGTLFVRCGKGAKQRVIPLHAEAAACLETHLDGQRSGPVFLSNRRKRISYDRIHSRSVEIGREAKLRKRLHPHVFRHSFAVALLDADTDLETIRDLMGHESIETTSIYLHCSTAKRRVAVDRL